MIFGGGAKDNHKLEARPDIRTFTSEPLTSDTTIMGSVSAQLFVRSSLQHTDFYARLCDVSTNGKSINICDGITRLTPTTNTSSSDHVRPATIDLGATAHRFHAGHRIRLQISSGAHPRHNRNLGTGEPVATATAMRSADQEVVHDSSHPSALILPTAAK